jgi:hypothetical protein
MAYPFTAAFDWEPVRYVCMQPQLPQKLLSHRPAVCIAPATDRPMMLLLFLEFMPDGKTTRRELPAAVLTRLPECH